MWLLVVLVNSVPASSAEARARVAVETAAIPSNVIAAHDVKDVTVVVLNLVEVHVLEGHVLGVQHGNLQPAVVVRTYDAL